MTDRKIIKLGGDTYNRLDERKRGESFNAYITKLLRYFDVTGIDPESLQAPMAAEIKNSNDRVIKLLKSMEKLKLDPIMEILKSQALVGGTRAAIEQSSQLETSGLTPEKFEQLVALNEGLDKQNAALRIQVSELQKEINFLKAEGANRQAEPHSDPSMLLELLDTLEAQAQPKQFSNTVSFQAKVIHEFIGKMRNAVAYVREDL